MATTGTEQPTSQGFGADDRNAFSGTSRDRRAAGEHGGLMGLVRETTYQRLGFEKDRASDTLGGVAGAIRAISQQLRDEGQGGVGSYLDSAAQAVDRWAEDLRRQDLEDTLHRLDQFARREPTLFYTLAFGLGVVTARFLKSSPRDSFERDALAGGTL